MMRTIRVELERPKNLSHKQLPWKSSPPFVANSRGSLIHRPRSGSTYDIHDDGPHISIAFWCGMHVTSSGKNLTFLADPGKYHILCERCEDAAVAKGLPTADHLAGRHVHIGRTIAVATCCGRS